MLIAFEYTHHEEDWVTPLEDALAGVRAQEAAWKPGPDIKGIWEIVLHMAAWTQNIVERMAQRQRREMPGKPPQGDWPALPTPLDEAAWEAAQQQLWDALSALRTHIEETPPAAMLDYGNVGYSHFDNLLCRLIHNAYHIGQITKMREWRAAQDVSAT